MSWCVDESDCEVSDSQNIAWFVGYKLIGGDVSVTSADPGIVQDTVRLVKDINADIMVLCGAGVKTGEDVNAALRLGAEGVLLASGVTKASDPAAVLQDLVDGARGA